MSHQSPFGPHGLVHPPHLCARVIVFQYAMGTYANGFEKQLKDQVEHSLPTKKVRFLQACRISPPRVGVSKAGTELGKNQAGISVDHCKQRNEWKHASEPAILSKAVDLDEPATNVAAYRYQPES